MRRTGLRLAIADPSLLDARGHHFALSLQIARGAQSQDVNVVWFAHREFVCPEELQAPNVYPVFSATMYDRYRRERSSSSPSDIGPTLLKELHRAISISGLRSTDHVLFHTAFGDLYRALRQYVSAANWRGMPHLHLCTPYDLNTMPGKEDGTSLQDVMRDLRTIEGLERKVFFWAETPQLALHYTLTYGINVRALPLPVPAGLSFDTDHQTTDTVTALYLGAAREEKGFLHLPEVAARLYEPYGRSGRLRFVVQCTPQIVGYLPTIRAAIDKLSAFPSSYVRLIDTVLSEDHYYRELAASDVVLLLYDRNNYGIRGSGIAVEAVCSGKCLITHKDTFCASLITHEAGGAVENLDDAVSLLRDIVERKPQYMQRARIQGLTYRADNSSERYVSRILTRANPAYLLPFSPGAIIGHISPSLLKC